MTDLCFFEELPEFLEHCVNNQSSIAGDFSFHVEDVSNSNTKKLRDLVYTFCPVQTVSGPTHMRGHTVDLAFRRASDNLIHSTRTSHGLTSDYTAILCPRAAQKPTQTVKFESIR